jgi:F-type H+-transporting ATPase subunit delta
MAENITIARPYAKAVFEQAVAGRALDEWEQILQTLAAVAADSQMAALLDSPLVSDQQLLTLFTQIVGKIRQSLSADLQKELNNFLQVLISEKRLAVLPEILRRYQSLVAAERGLKKVVVTSAFPLDEQRRKNMTESLSRYLHSKVAVDFKEDASLIGGAVIRSGNWVMDGSIKGKLHSLRDNLQE